MKKHTVETLRLCLARLGIRSMKSWLCVGKRLLWFINLVQGCTFRLGFTLAVNWEEREWERALLSQNYEGNLSKLGLLKSREFVIPMDKMLAQASLEQ